MRARRHRGRRRPARPVGRVPALPCSGSAPGRQHDLGRLVAEAAARADHLTCAGIREGLERIKMLPSATGRAGTTMGFGQWDRAALKGEYLVLRRWDDGVSRELVEV